MAISVTTALSKPEGSVKIPRGTLGYIKARGRRHAYELVIREFKKSGITQAALASRIGKPVEVICRWLGRPTNMELDTFTTLLFGISGALPTFGVGRSLSESSEILSSIDDSRATIVFDDLNWMRGFDSHATAV